MQATSMWDFAEPPHVAMRPVLAALLVAGAGIAVATQPLVPLPLTPAFMRHGDTPIATVPIPFADMPPHITGAGRVSLVVPLIPAVRDGANAIPIIVNGAIQPPSIQRSALAGSVSSTDPQVYSAVTTVHIRDVTQESPRTMPGGTSGGTGKALATGAHPSTGPGGIIAGELPADSYAPVAAALPVFDSPVAAITAMQATPALAAPSASAALPDLMADEAPPLSLTLPAPATPSGEGKTMAEILPTLRLAMRAAVAPHARNKPGRAAGMATARPAPASAKPAQASTSLRMMSDGVEFDVATQINGAPVGTLALWVPGSQNDVVASGLWVRLGDMLDLLRPQMDHSLYETLSASRNADDYVSLNTLRGAGIAVAFDGHDQLMFGVR